MDPVFHEALKQHVAPAWPILHKVLSLPEFLLGAKIPKSFDESLGAEVERRDSPLPGPRSSLRSKNMGGQSLNSFLRAGSSTRSLPLMKILLDMLRMLTRYKFICFCLDDLHFADEESLELIAQIISTRIKLVIIVAYRPEDVSSETMRGIIDLYDNEGALLKCNHIRGLLTKTRNP